MRLSYDTYKQLVELLGQISEITNMYENRDFMFSNTVKRWLKNVEDIYNQNSLPGVAEFSTSRLRIISAERGVLREGGSPYKSKRKYVAFVTIDAITGAASSLQSLVSVLDADFVHSKESIRKLLIDVLSSGKIKGSLKDYSDAMEIWQTLLTTPKTSGLAAEILEMISYSDAAFLMIEIFQDLASEQRSIVRNSINGRKEDQEN